MRKDCVARELTREIIVGAFMVMVFLGLGYFTIILSRETWFGEDRMMEIVFENVMGLRESDGVVVRGMSVGKVKNLTLKEDGVHILAQLDKPIEMHEGYAITVVQTSILGGRHLQIETGPSSADKIEIEDHVFDGETPYDIMADAAELINSIKTGFVEGKIVENIQSASVDLKEISQRLSQGKGTLGKLLSEDTALYRDLSDTVASVKAVADRLEKGEGTIGKLLAANDTVYEDLKVSASSLRQISERLSSGKGTLGRLLSEEDDVYEDLAASAESLRTIAERLEDGEGMIGRLLTEDDLYEELEAAVVELRATIEDFRETAPVTTFSSVFFGAF